jgi:hypothetical protein
MMGFKGIFTFSLLFLMAIASYPGVSPGEERSGIQVVETEGIAAVVGFDLAAARDEAVRDALQKAVARTAGRWLAPQQEERQYKVLKEKLYDRAEGFIQDFRILFEISDSEIYSVTVRATVFAEDIRKDLQELGLIASPLQNPPLIRISLTLRGVRDYGDYVRWRAMLQDLLPGIRGVILREASWGMTRFEVAVEGTVSAVAARLREKLGVEVQQRDERAMEVDLRRRSMLDDV